MLRAVLCFTPRVCTLALMLTTLASATALAGAPEPFAGPADDARPHPAVHRVVYAGVWPFRSERILATEESGSPAAWRQFDRAWLEPNERQPINGRRLFETAPEGVHVGVGTERVLFGALLNPNATHVLMFDLNPSAVAYFRTNVALFELSADHRDYLALRFQASIESIRDRANEAWNAGRISLISRDVLFAAAAHASLDVMRDSESRFRPGATGGLFRGVNYLADPELYARLAGLAKEGRIAAVTASFSVERERQVVVGAIARNGLRIGVLDLSNAWQPNYSQMELSPFLVRIDAHVAPGARLVLTHWEASEPGRPWHYFGFTLERLRGASTPIENGILRAKGAIMAAPQGELDFPRTLRSIGGQ